MQSMSMIQLFFITSLLCLLIDLLLFGFATMVLSLLGLTLLLVVGLASLDVIADDFYSLLLTSVLIFPILALILWKPLKRLQAAKTPRVVKSDLVGLCFVTEQAIDGIKSQVKHRYSGFEWTLKSQQTIPAGSEVEVIQAEVGVFWVKIRAE